MLLEVVRTIPTDDVVCLFRSYLSITGRSTSETTPFYTDHFPVGSTRGAQACKGLNSYQALMRSFHATSPLLPRRSSRTFTSSIGPTLYFP